MRNNKETALITGITGQDGSYLREIFGGVRQNEKGEPLVKDGKVVLGNLDAQI
jgi:hypothetical protein